MRMGAYQHKKSMLKKWTKLTLCTPPFCTLEQVSKFFCNQILFYLALTKIHLQSQPMSKNWKNPNGLKSPTPIMLFPKKSLAEMTQKRWGLIKCLQNSCSNFTQHEAYVHVIRLSISSDINCGVDYVAGVRAHGRSPFECKERRQKTWTVLSFPPDGFSMSTWLVF
jgi:hypothetical protein